MSISLRNAIQHAVEQSTPVLRVCVRSKTWWNDEISTKRKLMSSKMRSWRRNRTNNNFESYKTARNEYFREIRVSKQTTWNSFLEKAQNEDVFKALRYCKARKYQKTSTLQYDNKIATTFQQKSEMLREALFPRLNNSNNQNTEIQTNRQQINYHDISNNEVKQAIFTSNTKKAAGPDRINFLCIRHAYECKTNAFNKLYRALARKGYHPECWREAIGAIIPKPNKSDYTTPKAYRIIALLNCLGKVLEKILATRLSYYVEKHDLLNKEQMRGRKQRSAIDAVMCLVHDVQNAQSQRLKSTSLMLDVKGAFDNVSRARLLSTMRSLSIADNIIAWTKDFMSKRQISLAFDNDKEDMSSIEIGIPQGSP